MKFALFLIACIVVYTSPLFAQSWNDDQIQIADQARDISYLSDAEKDAIKYINLCRMYPREFAEIEVKRYEIDSLYWMEALRAHAESKQSLIRQLETQKEAERLSFDEQLFEDAKCYAAEISKNERRGHERKDCPSTIRHAECLSFGMATGKEIVFQWLLDTGVASLGHRMICLDPKYRKIAIKAEPHFQWEQCAVGEFN